MRGALRPDARYVAARMIAWIAFVVAFVALGLGVVLIAFRGGPRGRRAPAGQGRGRRGPSRGNRAALGVGVAAIVVLLGLVVPGLIMAGNSQEEKGPGGVALNDSDVDGRQVFARYCSNCHTLKGANAVGKVGPNLDELRPPKALVLDAIAEGRARGQGQMPRNLVDGEDAQNVANFIVKVAGR
jgi:mono/diheme cytochrome c family protein